MADYAVIFDRGAADDLAAIRDYLAAVRDDAFAATFVERIVTYCERFGPLPHRGTARDEIRAGLRTVGWRRTITIAFEVNDDLKRVAILGIFYRGRDVEAALRQRGGG